MKLYQQLERELRRGVRETWRRHGNVRRAASALGMPRMTFHDKASEMGIDMSRGRRARRSS